MSFLLLEELSEESVASVGFQASSDKIRAEWREDTAIATIQQNATVPLNDRQYNCSAFEISPMTREQALKRSPEILGLCNNCEQLMMNDSFFIQKWYNFGKDGY